MTIQSVDRALSILSLFSATKTHLGITEIAKFLNLTNPTTHGMVKTLQSRGFLCQDPDTKKYSLGTSSFELSHYFLGASKVYQAGAAAVHRLSEETGLNTRLAILEKDMIVIILTVYSRSERFQYLTIGPRVPLYCTSMGKAILARLPENDLTQYIENTSFHPFTSNTINDPKQLRENLKKVNNMGYTEDREEMLKNTFCIAAPLLDRNNFPLASLSLSSGPDLFTHKKFSSFADSLIRTATDISYSLGCRNIIY
jgi:IclR family transcriptional regulator, KDG regulon repressor